MDSYKRLDLSKCNTIKVVMMLSIILCHSLAIFSKIGWGADAPITSSLFMGAISDWIGTFHVYTFTFVSGYIFCYSYNEIGKYRDFLTAVKQRMKRLLIPYWFVTIIWVVPFYIVFFRPSINQVVHRFILGESPAQLWFVWMIFIVFILFLKLVNTINKIKFIPGLIVSLGVMGVGLVGAKICPNFFQIWTACNYFLFFYLGYSFRRFDVRHIYSIPWLVWPIINIGLFLFKSFWLQGQANIIYTLVSLIAVIVMEIAGVLMMIVGISSINTNRIQKTRLFIFFEKYNFGMYLFHQQIIYISIRFLNGVVPNIILVINNFIWSCVLSAIITWILCRWKITKGLIGIS